MGSPFDDPDFRAQLEGMGVVHRPGMADEMLRQLAPLLTAEGIDLDNLAATDLDTFNAALARATERHNFELFTPVGVPREGALAVLRLFSTAVADGDDQVARAVLVSVESDPVDDGPAISDVIGVSLGVLDRWHTDPGMRAGLSGTRIPGWEKRSRAAATDILALARKGRAFDAIESLHRRHSGFAIFEGAVLATAASTATLAKHDHTTVPDLVERLLAGSNGTSPVRVIDGAGSAGGVGSGAAFGLGSAPRTHVRPVAPPPRFGQVMTPASADRPLARGFGRWLRRSAHKTAAEAAAGRGELEMLFAFARTLGIDLHQPDGAEEVADELVELLTNPDEPDDLGVPGSLVDTLHDYVHFRIDTSDDPDVWDDAHDAIEDAAEEVAESFASDAITAAIADAIRAGEQIDPEVRRAALAGTPVVAAVGELLEWVGMGRPASPSGGVRRADIQHVAGLLGISAVGVSKRPPLDPILGDRVDLDGSAGIPGTIHALSMGEVPPLAAWWEALDTTELLQTRSSRVRPGPNATHWSAMLPPLEIAEMLAGVYVAEILTQQTRTGTAAVFDEYVVAETIRQLLGILAPALVPETTPDGLESLVTPHVLTRLHHLQTVGLLEHDPTGGFVIPDTLRDTIARGVLLALSLLATDLTTETDE